MDIQKNDSAVVFTDPQNEVLSDRGLGWPPLRESLRELRKRRSLTISFVVSSLLPLNHQFSDRAKRNIWDHP